MHKTLSQSASDRARDLNAYIARVTSPTYKPQHTRAVLDYLAYLESNEGRSRTVAAHQHFARFQRPVAPLRARRPQTGWENSPR